MKRQVRKTGGHESSGLYIELVLVVDYTIYRRNNGDMHTILKRVFDIVNVIKEVNLYRPIIHIEAHNKMQEIGLCQQIYSSLQVSVMLVGVIVWSQGDWIHIGNDVSETLKEFKKYANAHLELKLHDTTHLMM